MVDGDHGFHGLVDIREVAGTHSAEDCRAQDGAFPIAQQNDGPAKNVSVNFHERSRARAATRHAKFRNAAFKVACHCVDHETDFTGAPLEHCADQTAAIVIKSQTEKGAARHSIVIRGYLAGEKWMEQHASTTRRRCLRGFDDQIIDIRSLLSRLDALQQTEMVAPPFETAAYRKRTALGVPFTRHGMATNIGGGTGDEVGTVEMCDHHCGGSNGHLGQSLLRHAGTNRRALLIATATAHRRARWQSKLLGGLVRKLAHHAGRFPDRWE